MPDYYKTIIKYILMIIIIFILFKYVLPVLMKFLGGLLAILVQVAMWGLIIFILYLLGNFIYQSYKNKD